MSKPTKFHLSFLILIGFILVVTNSCTDKSLLPVVETTKLTGVSSTTLTCWGNVPADAGSAISARGACWSTSPNPTTSNSKQTSAAGTGNFKVAVSGLTMGTTYYIRCYATNSTGTSYGGQLTFTTLLEDVDGNTYHTVMIGKQEWMVENLKVGRYRDGTLIHKVTDPTVWGSQTKGAYCSYNEDNTDSITYGHLYNWSAVTNSKYLAPTGWHIPTQAEWTTLMTYLGGASVAADKLKATGTTYWTGNYAGATNSSGFTALPGGSISLDNNVYGFYNLGIIGQWWSATEVSSGSSNAYSWYINNTSSEAINDKSLKQIGLSVRCIKD